MNAMLRNVIERMALVPLHLCCLFAVSHVTAGDGVEAMELSNATTQPSERIDRKIKENALTAQAILLNNENNHVPLERTIAKVTFKYDRGVVNTASG